MGSVFFISKAGVQKFICVLINSENSKEKWLISEITENTYEELKSNEIDFYTCFKQSKSGNSFVLSITNEHIDDETKIISSEIPDDILPNKGVYLLRNSNDLFASPF